MTNEIVTKDEFTVKAQVGMEEMVSCFLAKWESGLYEKKDVLQAELKNLREELEGLHKELKKKVDTSDYEMSNKALGIRSSVSKVSIEKRREGCLFLIEVVFYDLGNTTGRGAGRGNGAIFGRGIEVKMKKADSKKILELHESIEAKKDELSSVIHNIGDMSRKERQVRGRIAEKKLQDAGMDSLLNDSEMMKLVQL